jgi:hypothetical protein
VTRELERVSHRRSRARRLDDDVESTAGRRLGDGVGEVFVGGVEREAGAESDRSLSPARLRLHERDGGVVRGRRHHAEQSDWASAEDRDRVGRVDSVGADGCVVGDGERLDERPLRVRELLRKLVQPLAARLEVLGIGAVDGEAEVVSAFRPDDALADHTVAGFQALDGGPHLDHLAAPLVARHDRVGDRDDVAPLVELEVRVADTDGVRADEHLVGADLGMLDVGHDCAARRFEDKGLHVLPPPVTECSSR